jgi:hypothetical protein
MTILRRCWNSYDMTKSLGYHQEEMANQPAEQEECGSDL